MIFPLESIDLEAMVQRLTVFCSEVPTCLWRVGKHRNVVSWSLVNGRAARSQNRFLLAEEIQWALFMLQGPSNVRKGSRGREERVRTYLLLPVTIWRFLASGNKKRKTPQSRQMVVMEPRVLQNNL